MSFVKFQYLNCNSAIVSEVNEIKKKSPNFLEGHFFFLFRDMRMKPLLWSVQNCLLFSTALTFLEVKKKFEIVKTYLICLRIKFLRITQISQDIC